MCIELNGRDAYADFGVVRVGNSNITGRLLTTPTALVGHGSTGKTHHGRNGGWCRIVGREV